MGIRDAEAEARPRRKLELYRSEHLVLNIRAGVTFHDGTPLDAEAVKFNLERNKSDPKSNIKADLAGDGVRRESPARCR